MSSERLATLLFSLIGGGLAAWLLLSEPAAAPTPAPPPNQLERVLARGSLRVATIRSPATYLKVGGREYGMEYDLARLFAEHLGVKLEMYTEPRFAAIFDAVNSGKVDLAAATITVTPARRELVNFGPPYQHVTQEVIYRSGSMRPRDPDDLALGEIAVIDGSSYVETLRELAAGLPDLQWQEKHFNDLESLFSALARGEMDFTIADSNLFAVHRRFYPNLRRAFSISDPQPIAWAFPYGTDRSLTEVAENFFQEIADSGVLQRIKDKHHAHLQGYDRVNTPYFLRHVRERLPALREHFVAAANRFGLSWRLLAAVAYQESLWDPDAVSPTGVRGIMMLTHATASELGVSDRENPVESIFAGAEYLVRMKRKIPERIPEPDRTWMALAAYNIGYGHLEDARVLAQRLGRDPDRWRDVAKTLPLLSDRRYYVHTRYGYARGGEPVQYVRNIRSYYDILNWQTARSQRAAGLERVQQDAGARPGALQ